MLVLAEQWKVLGQSPEAMVIITWSLSSDVFSSFSAVRSTDLVKES
jgi:hypothetical protein